MMSISVSTQADLNNAIEQIDAATTPGDYVINLTSDIVEGQAGEPAGLFALLLNTGVDVAIEGNGHTIFANGSAGGLAVLAGTVSIEDLTLDATVAQGGDGGGGGAGLGGGLFVGAAADVTLSNVTFLQDSAVGGDGAAPGAGGAGGNDSVIVPLLGTPGLDGTDGDDSEDNGVPGDDGTDGTDGGVGYAGGKGGDGGSGNETGGDPDASPSDGGAGGNGGHGGSGGAGGDGGDGGIGGFGSDYLGGEGGAGGAAGQGGDGGDGGGGGAGGAGGTGNYAGKPARSAPAGVSGAGADGGDAGNGGFGAGGGSGGNGGQGGDGGVGAGSFYQTNPDGSPFIAIPPTDGGNGAAGGSGGAGGDGDFGGGGGGGGAGGNGGAAGVGDDGNPPGVDPYYTSANGDPGEGGDGGSGGKGGFGAGDGADGTSGGIGGDGTYLNGEPVGSDGGPDGESGAGGGGLGAGGDVFVAEGGKITVIGGTLSGGTATGGKAGGDGASDGDGYGSGIFIQGNNTLVLEGPPASALVIFDVITDMAALGSTGTGTVEIKQGTVGLAATNTFTGGIIFDEGLLELAAPDAAGSGAITFANAGTSELEFSHANAPANEIDEFAVGDTIRIDGFSFATESYDGATLALDGPDGALDLDLPAVMGTFDITQDSAGTTITLETVACYVSGTLIRTGRGEIPAEALVIGDRVITMSGETQPIRWIGRRSYGGRFVMGRTDILPVCFKAGSLADHVPARDLWVSPHHAMYFRDDREGGVLIEARDLVNGVSVVQAGQADSVDYIHIELDSHDVIIAEGALSETFVDDDSRWMFHNAHEYAGLYGDDTNPLAVYCAPRRRDGFVVQAVRRRIDARAGLLCANGSCTLPLRGYVDGVDSHCISGWAQNPDYPEAPICLDIVIDGRLIGQALANVYRPDLKAAGLGSGCHAFVFAPPPGTPIGAKRVQVLRSLDGAVLQQSAHAQGHAA